MKIYIIVATDKNFGIGKEGTLPWQLTKEMKYFRKTTTETVDKSKENMVIMGRTTWESISEKYRPLIDRRNVVLTTKKNYKGKGAHIAHSFKDALKFADKDIETVFIIGGSSVYYDIIADPALTGIYLTRILDCYDSDTFFPEIPKKFSKITEIKKEEEGGVEFKYFLYEKE